MEKYRRVQNEKKESQPSADDEIRITARGRTSTYISYAAKLFNEKEMSSFTLKATGSALATAVTVAEVIKRRFKGLHQITKLGAIEVTDEWEPIEEGLDNVTANRNVSFIEILLSKEQLDKDDKGYQEPISEELVTEYDAEEVSRGRRNKGSNTSDGSRKGKGKGKGKKGKGKGKGAKGKGKGKKGKGKKGKGKGKKGRRGDSSDDGSSDDE